MPFKSEKQRRFLWAEHPEIAKRWAHKYPKSNKNLPMYARTNESEKKSALEVLSRVLSVTSNNSILNTLNKVGVSETKQANSGLKYIQLPQGKKPDHSREMAAGESAEDSENPESANCAENARRDTVADVFGKLAVVLAKPLREAMEQEESLKLVRDPRFVPENIGIRPQAAPAPASALITPPIGMQAAPGQQPVPQQAQQQAQSGPVGGGSNPQFNPINSFGALGARGQLNGNAAFGSKNSPDSSKTASDSGAWTRAEGKNPEGGLNAKGRASLKAQGHDIKPPVTESNPKGDRAKRQNSFCSRMCGMKKHETGAKTKSDPDSRINKSLRKWNCKCSSAMEFGYELGEKLADEHGGLFGPAGYVNQLSRWYNPMDKQQITDPSEQWMMRAGQGALGLGAAAGAAAGGIAAAAPGLASTNLSALPAYFAGNTAAQAGAATAGAGGTAVSSRGQQIMQGAQNMANSATQALSRGVDFYANKVEPTMKKLQYKPETAISDAYSAVRGDFKSIKGPGLYQTPSLGVAGAPSMPSPYQMANKAFGAVKNVMN